MAKLKATIGVAAGIFDGEGKLLIKRRQEHDSITDKDYHGCWELPVVAVQDTPAVAIPYDYLCRELKRGVKAETDLNILVEPLSAFYPVMFKNDKGEYDLAMITIVYCGNVHAGKTENQIRFVDVAQLNKLAMEYAPVEKDKVSGAVIKEGKGLVSGFGKRMHCLALKALEAGSSSMASASVAKTTLADILKNWI